MTTVNRLKKGSRQQPQQNSRQQAQESASLTPPFMKSMSAIGSSNSIPDGRIPPYNEGAHTKKAEQQYENYLSYAACNPAGVTFTSALFPHNCEMNMNLNVPLGIFLSPMIALQNENCDVMEKTVDKIPRCATCSCYMNCYNQIIKNKFNCFLCNRETLLDKQYLQQPDRRELDSSIYQCLSSPNFYPKEPTEQCFVFLVDITRESSNCKMLYYLTAVIKEVFARPELDDLCIYFFTFDESLHYYDFSGEEVQCTIIDQSIQQKMAVNKFEPMYLRDIRDKLMLFVNQLEQMSQNNHRTGYNFYKPFKLVFQSLKHISPKFFVFQTNEALMNDQYFCEKPVQPNSNSQPGVNGSTRSGSFFQARNKLFFNQITQESITIGCSFSFYFFSRGYKNLRNVYDTLKITGSQLKVYAKDTPVELDKFYYELSYLLGATYFKDVRIQFLSSAGWQYVGVYGNSYKMKEANGVFFQINWAEPSRKFLILVNPSTKGGSPFCGVQICINYRYKRQSYATVVTIVQPVTGYLTKFYNSIDGNAAACTITKKMLSALRLEAIGVLRNRLIKQLSSIYTCAVSIYKKPEQIPASITTIILTGLALLKSAHSQPEVYLSLPVFDKMMEQRNVLQFSGMSQLGPFWNPYLFDLSDLDPSVCQQAHFTYPPTIQPYFHHVKQGLFLLDNGLCLYLFIAKQCDPDLLAEVFGKAKFTKHDILTQEIITEQTGYRAMQVLNLIRVLREQKMYGWQPLYIIRCGQNTLREKNFYLNFYREKYDQYRSYKLNLQEFQALLSKQNIM